MDQRAGRLSTFLSAALVALLTQTGCAAIGLTMFATALGLGAGTATSYTLNGYAYRTFAAPLPAVERASKQALRNMGIQIDGRETTEQGAMLLGTANERSVKVRLERVTTRTTRVRTVVRINTILMDRATATEIIIQTEEVLARTALASH